MIVYVWTVKKEMHKHTHRPSVHGLTSSVQVQTRLSLLLLDGLVEEQSGLSVEASAVALNCKIIVGENQLKLHLFLHRATLILFLSGLCLTSDLLLLLLLFLLAQLHSLDQILDGCREVF